MTLKWTGVIVAVVSLTLCVTANVVTMTMDGRQVPVVVNVLAVATTTGAALLAFVAGLHERLEGRLTALTEFLVARLNDVEAAASDRNAGFVEGCLLDQVRDGGAVVPIGPRLPGHRVMVGGDD